MRIYRYILLFILATVPLCRAFSYDNITFHCDSDTTLIDSLLACDELKDMTPAKRVAFFAEKLIGSTSSMREEILEADTTLFTLNVHSFTPLSFLSTCVALAQAYETSSSPNWRNFADRYERVMYKSGKAGNFTSKFLYGSDWITDNMFRGNVDDATLYLTDSDSAGKKNRSITFQAIRMLSKYSPSQKNSNG